MYWTQRDPPAIWQSDLNGDNCRPLITTNIALPEGLVVSDSGANLYWADSILDKIEVVSLYEGGFARRTLIDFELDHPIGLTINESTGLDDLHTHTHTHTFLHEIVVYCVIACNTCTCTGVRLLNNYVTSTINMIHSCIYVHLHVHTHSLYIHNLGTFMSIACNTELWVYSHVHVHLQLSIIPRYIYWTDIGITHYGVEEAAKDGSHRRQIQCTDTCHHPGPITVDSSTGDVYFADKTQDHLLYYTPTPDHSGIARKSTIDVEQQHVAGLTILNNEVFWTDRIDGIVYKEDLSPSNDIKDGIPVANHLGQIRDITSVDNELNIGTHKTCTVCTLCILLYVLYVHVYIWKIYM